MGTKIKGGQGSQRRAHEEKNHVKHKPHPVHSCTHELSGAPDLWWLVNTKHVNKPKVQQQIQKHDKKPKNTTTKIMTANSKTGHQFRSMTANSETQQQIRIWDNKTKNTTNSEA